MERDSEIEQARSDLLKLIKENKLPPKMEAKLKYLEAGALGQQPPSSLLQELPQFEQISLQMMSKETKSSLFNSIVRCLAGKDIATYFTAEQSAIKRQDSSAKSTPCFISCTSESFSICRNKEETQPLHLFPISKLLVAKTYHREKKKFVFGIAFEGVKYRLKFEKEGPCARIHGDLLTAIREKRALRMQSEQKLKRQNEMTEQLQLQSQWDETGEELILNEEKQYLKLLMKKIEESQMESTDHYQLVRNIDSGKIMVNHKTGTVKVLMFLERCSLEGLIESYIQFASWNVQVETFEITKRIRRNTFLAHISLKKKNLFWSPREGSFTITYFKLCPCFKGSHAQTDPDQFQVKHYLVLSQAEEVQQKRNGVPMKFNQILEFAEVQGRPGIVFINIVSSIDFNVFQYFQSSTDLNLQFLQEVGSIAVLCRERQIMKSGSCQLFDFGLCVCERKKRKETFQSFSAVKAPLVEQSRKNSILSEPDHRSLPFEEASPSKHQEDTGDFSFKEIVAIIADHNNMKVNQKVVELISKKMFERYYLKHRFSEEPHEQPYIDSEYRMGERVNYLSIGDRWKFNTSEEFVFIDEEVLTLQKGVLKLIIKQITSNILAGKSIMSMSLPVELFDDFSLLESFAQLFGYAPVFMNKAVKETRLEQQIKYVMLSFAFLLSANPKVSKPFNPILGQTLQGSLGGIPFYMEQVSHHPPITNFYMKNQHFQAHGSIDLVVDMGFNTAHSKFPSPFHVKFFSNNTDYIIRFPEVELGGVMVGDRVLRPSGRGFVLQKRSGTYLQYAFGKDKKKLYEYKEKVRHADIAGGVFKITERAVERLLNMDRKKSVEGIKPEQALQHFSLISGKWYGDIYFDGNCYKSMKNGPFPIEFQRQTLLLPSDCTFRLDIVYRRWRDFKKSNEEKEVLQNLQRRDRKLREKHHPHKKH